MIVTSDSTFQHGSSFMAFLWFYRTKRVINQGNFKLHWWVHQTGGYEEMDGAILSAQDAIG